MRGLFIRSPWVEKILAGEKTWEIRGSATRVRGTFALIKSGSASIVGVADLVDSRGPLSLEQLRANAAKAGFRAESLKYKQTHAWVLDNVRPIAPPVPFVPKPGAVIWTTLDDAVSETIRRRLTT